jgi:hypothetical protein
MRVVMDRDIEVVAWKARGGKGGKWPSALVMKVAPLYPEMIVRVTL